MNAKKPLVIETPAEMRRASADARSRGLSVGLVPTMGALHDGHLALIHACRRASGLAVVSIFVNPAQFGPNEDFHRYPRDPGGDLRRAAAAGADVVFAPAAAHMYPPGFRTFVEVKGLSRALCGRFRPGHFRGVATVVLKLFQVVAPDQVWFGWKDAQQLIVIRRMVRDLDLPVTVTGLPTVREADGLALSSRNRYLDAGQRRAAPAIYRNLEAIRAAVENRDIPLGQALDDARARLDAVVGLRLQYLAAVSPETLRPVSGRRAGQALVLAAAHLGATRLIDNIMVATGGGKPGTARKAGIRPPAGNRIGKTPGGSSSAEKSPGRKREKRGK